MRRDIGNELVVALFAAVSLLFAGLFALLLASSTQNPPAPASPTGAPVEQVATVAATAFPDLSATAVLSSITPQAPATDLESPSPIALATHTVQAATASTASATADTTVRPETSATARPALSVTVASVPATAASATLETVSAPPTRTPAPATSGKDDAPSPTPLAPSTLSPDISATYTATAGLTTEGAQLALTEPSLPIGTATETVTLSMRPDATNPSATSPALTLTEMPASQTARPASLTRSAELTTAPEDQPADLVIDGPRDTSASATTDEVTAPATDTAAPEMTVTADFPVSTEAPTATASKTAPLTATTAFTAPPADTLTAIPTEASVATSKASPIRLRPTSTASAMARPVSETAAATAMAIGATAAAPDTAEPSPAEAAATWAFSALTDRPAELAHDGQTPTLAPALASDGFEATLPAPATDAAFHLTMPFSPDDSTSIPPASATPVSDVAGTTMPVTRRAAAIAPADRPAASATAAKPTLTPASLATDEPGSETAIATPSPISTSLLPAETALLETAIPGATDDAAVKATVDAATESALHATFAAAAASTPTATSTLIKRIRTLNDFLLQLYDTAARPSRPTIVSVQTQAPEPTTATITFQPDTTPPSETSAVTVKATIIGEPAEVTASALPLVRTVLATAPIAPATATAVSATDEATLPVETPEIVQTDPPNIPTGILMDTLTAMPVARATEVDASDEPAETTASLTRDKIVQTGARQIATAIAVDTETETVEAALALTATSVARASEVDATDEPAEATASLTRDKTASTGARQIATAIAVDTETETVEAALALTATSVARATEVDASDEPAETTASLTRDKIIQTDAPETATAIAVDTETETVEAALALTATSVARATEVDATDEPAEATASLTRDKIVQTGMPTTATAIAVDTETETVEATLALTATSVARATEVDASDEPAEATASLTRDKIVQTGMPTTATVIAVDTETETVEATLALTAGTETGVLAARDLTAITTGLPKTAVMPTTASAKSATPAGEQATPTATFAPPTSALEDALERPTATDESFLPLVLTIAADASPLPHTATAIPSPTARPSATDAPTALPAALAYLIATPTAYGSRPADLEPACKVRQDWAPYEVQFGDTLLALALAADTDLITLREANCLSPVNGILAGDTIVVPLLTGLPLAMPEPVFPPAAHEYEPGGCASPDAQIQSPMPGAQLSGIFEIAGRATVPEGGAYEISIMPAWSDAFHKLLEIDISVDDNVIGLVNSEIFGPGLQRLRLALVDKDGARLEDSVCEVPVVFLAP